MITVVEVKTKKQKKQFLNFPLKLYKKCKYFVPPLYVDEKKMFKKNYMYYDQSEAVFYNAYVGKKMVGRIQGILQRAANEKNNQKRVRFTRFDSINNQEVANALFSKVENWAKEKQMNELVGPLGFSDLEREGLLIEGFEELSTFEEQYNYEYYKTLIENYGFKKEIDWVERKLYYPKVVDDRLGTLSAKILEKYNLRYGEAKNTKDFIKKYADKFFDIVDETYVDIYGSVPFTEGMRKMMIDNFKIIINIKNVVVIVDENDDVVCFGLCFPSLANAIRKSKGHLTPLALLRILKAIKYPKIIDLALIGVVPKYAMKGVSSALINKVLEMLSNKKIKHAETNLNLETNYHIQNQWKSFDSILHKRRRCFVKTIE